jgi:hypothetical protein
MRRRGTMSEPTQRSRELGWGPVEPSGTGRGRRDVPQGGCQSISAGGEGEVSATRSGPSSQPCRELDGEACEVPEYPNASKSHVRPGAVAFSSS